MFHILPALYSGRFCDGFRAHYNGGPSHYNFIILKNIFTKDMKNTLCPQCLQVAICKLKMHLKKAK
jgi:hypothetical protein